MSENFYTLFLDVLLFITCFNSKILTPLSLSFHLFIADLQLAAELGKTLLERNKELENLLRAHQRKCEDQKQEIEVSFYRFIIGFSLFHKLTFFCLCGLCGSLLIALESHSYLLPFQIRNLELDHVWLARFE